MKNLFDQIAIIAPGILYLRGDEGVIPCPPNTNTANMLFVEAGGYTAGFSNLTETERTSVQELLLSQIKVFESTIKAKDFLIASPKVKTLPAEALVEAVTEAKKEDGQNKSIGLIVLSLAHYIDDLEKRVQTLEKK